MPSALLFETISYLTKEEMDDMLAASDRASNTMKSEFQYDKERSIIGSEHNFVRLDRLVLPSSSIGLLYLYVCIDAFNAINPVERQSHPCASYQVL